MNVYIMKNFSLKEVYFGLAEGDTHETVRSHKGNQDSPVGHWNFDVEEIKWGIVEGDLHEQYARAFLQALRREPPDEEWIVVVGVD